MLTTSLHRAKLAYTFDWSVFVSHRYGETTDDFLASLTVSLGTGHLKSGRLVAVRELQSIIG